MCMVEMAIFNIQRAIQGCKNIFLLTRPIGLVGGKKTLALMSFSLALISGSSFCHYVDSLHHYVNVCYLFIK